MSSYTCPKCDAQLPTSAINIEQGVALCAQCESLLPLADLLDYRKPSTELLAEVPRRCSLVQKRSERGNSILVKAPVRSIALGLFMLFFSSFWNGLTSVFVWGVIAEFYQEFVGDFPFWAPEINSEGGEGPEDRDLKGKIFLALFLVPFVLVGWGTAFATLFGFFGRQLVEIGRGEAKIKTGVGFLSWTKRFDPREIQRVRIGISSMRQNNRSMEEIVLEGQESIKFGTGLSEANRQWMKGIMQVLLTEEEGSPLHRQVMNQARTQARKNS